MKDLRTLLAAIVAAALAVEPLSSFAQPPANQRSLKQQTALSEQLSKAWTEIERNPRDALRIFESELPVWAAFSKQSTGYIDADRGTLIAALFAHNDAAAGLAWRRIRREAGSAVAQSEPSGDVLAWRRDWTSAFRSYRMDENVGTTQCPDTTKRGLDEAISGHLQRAIRLWSLRPDCYGPYNEADVRLALTGDAIAAQNEWSKARSTWIKAARQDRLEPQIDALTIGNIMALSMLYHLRTRIFP
jgi:hypothetical protein